MTQLNLIMNSLPRDLLEFVFFLAVGFTAGSVGIIQVAKINFYFFQIKLAGAMLLNKYQI